MDPNNYQGYPPYAPYPTGDDYSADYSGAPYPAQGPYPGAPAPYADPYAPQYPADAYNAGAYTPPPYPAAQYPADYADPYAAQPGAYGPDYAAPAGGYPAADYYPAPDYTAAPYQDPYAAPPYAPTAYPYSGEYAAPPADYAAYAPYAPVYQPQGPYAAPVAPPPYTPPAQAPYAPPVAPASPPQPIYTPQQPTTAQPPVAPAAPVAPAEPVESVETVAPVVPVAPVEPAAPVAPVEPATPVEPVVPAAPVEPVVPAAPVVPATPIQEASALTPEAVTEPKAALAERIDEALPLQTPKPKKKAVVLELSHNELKESEPEKAEDSKPEQVTPQQPAPLPAESEPEVEAEVEAEADSKTEVEVETDDGKTEAEVETDGELEVEVEAHPDKDVEIELETGDGEKTEVEVETQPDKDVEVEVETQPDKDVEVELETEPDGELEVESELEPREETDEEDEEHEPVVFESFDVFNDPEAEGAFNFTAPDGPSADEIVSVGAALSGETSDDEAEETDNSAIDNTPQSAPFDEPFVEPSIFDAPQPEAFEAFGEPNEEPFELPKLEDETAEAEESEETFELEADGEPEAFESFEEPGEELPEPNEVTAKAEEPEEITELEAASEPFETFGEPDEEPFELPEPEDETAKAEKPEETAELGAASEPEGDIFSAEALDKFEPIEAVNFEPDSFTAGEEGASEPFADIELPAPPEEAEADASEDFAATIVMPTPPEETGEPEFSADDVDEALEELQDEGVFEELTAEPSDESGGEDDLFAEFGGGEAAGDAPEPPSAPAEDFFNADSFGELAGASDEEPPAAFEPEAAAGDLFSADEDSFGEIAPPELPAAEDDEELEESADHFNEPEFEDGGFAGFGAAVEEAQIDADAEPSGFDVTNDEDEVAAPEGFDGFGAFDDFAAEPDGSQFAANDEQSDAPVAGNLFETSIMQIPLRRDDNDIDAISSTIDKELLARAYSQIYTDNNLMPEGDAPCLTVSGLEGSYYVARGEAEPAEMYKPVSFTLGAGCCCALVSDMPLASYSLAHDIAESYDEGDDSVSLSEGRQGKRREIIYLGSDQMLPDDLTSGEYLALALSPVSSDDGALKSEAATLLAQVGLGDMENEPLRDLSHNKRMLILSLCAAVNPRVGALIVSDSAFNIEGVEENIAKRVFALLCTNGKCALLTCCSPYLTGTVCNRVIALKGGDKIFDGSFHAFIDRYCLGVMSFTTEYPAQTVSIINRDFDNITALCKGQLVYLVKDGPGDVNIDALVDAAEANGAQRSSIVMDEKNFEIACKEVFESV